MKEDMRMDKNIDNSILENLARLVAERVLIYFEDEEHRREFEKYYFEKYNKPYQWSKTKGG